VAVHGEFDVPPSEPQNGKFRISWWGEVDLLPTAAVADFVSSCIPP
jgi:hypothetical protein